MKIHGKNQSCIHYIIKYICIRAQIKQEITINHEKYYIKLKIKKSIYESAKREITKIYNKSGKRLYKIQIRNHPQIKMNYVRNSHEILK